MSRLSEYTLFFREFRASFHDTGSIVPSGRALCRELVSRVAGDAGNGRNLLEAGPGTGVVTRQLLPLLGDGDRLTLVELNPKFVDLLRSKFAPGGPWEAYADRVAVLAAPIQEVDESEPFDFIVSGLPLSNFACPVVTEIFAKFHRLGRVDAELSFFEYAGLRELKGLFVNREERARLGGVTRLFRDEFARSEFDQRLVPANFPPAIVHHLRLGGPEAGRDDGISRMDEMQELASS